MPEGKLDKGEPGGQSSLLPGSSMNTSSFTRHTGSGVFSVHVDGEFRIVMPDSAGLKTWAMP